MTVDPAGENLFVSAQADNQVLKFSLPDLELVLSIAAEGKPDPVRLWTPPAR